MKHRALAVAKGWGTKIGQVCLSPAAALEGGSGYMATGWVGNDCSKWSERGFKEGGGRREQGAGRSKGRLVLWRGDPECLAMDLMLGITLIEFSWHACACPLFHMWLLRNKHLSAGTDNGKNCRKLSPNNLVVGLPHVLFLSFSVLKEPSAV